MVVVISQMRQVGIVADRFDCHPKLAGTCIRRPNGYPIPCSYSRAARSGAPGPDTATHYDSARDSAAAAKARRTAALSNGNQDEGKDCLHRRCQPDRNRGQGEPGLAARNIRDIPAARANLKRRPKAGGAWVRTDSSIRAGKRGVCPGNSALADRGICASHGGRQGIYRDPHLQKESHASGGIVDRDCRICSGMTPGTHY
jgi:hypothetical protein